MKKLIVLALTAMMAAGAHANITFNMWYDDARDHNGTEISDTSIFKIIADAEGDGLDAISGGTSTNDFATGDDKVMFTYSFDASYAGEVYMGSDFNNVVHPDTAYAEDTFYVVWYEGLTDTGATAPGEGQWMGILQDSSFLMPNDGDTVTFGGYPTSAEVINQSNVSYAQVGNPIPEPTTMLGMLILGAGAFLTNRRRSRN